VRQRAFGRARLNGFDVVESIAFGLRPGGPPGGFVEAPVQQLRNLDLLLYVRALGLLVRNPSIIVVPLLMNVVGVFIGQIGGGAGGGILGGLTSLLVLLLDLFAFGAACIIADTAWRRGRSSFDDGWNEARRKGGEILTAALGFTFVLFLPQFAATLFGGAIANVLIAVAIYFLIYTVPAAAIGGIPGGAALQVSIERVRANPLPTILVVVVSVAALFLSFQSLALFASVLAPTSFVSYVLLAALLSALVQAIAVGYIALVVTKTYTGISFGRR
jgi:hypothetical protein